MFSRKTKSSKESPGSAGSESADEPQSTNAAATAASSEEAGAPAPVDISGNEASIPQNLLLKVPEFAEVCGRPKAGFTTVGASGLQLLDGDGAGFQLRVGPDYKKHGNKAPSAGHLYSPITIDVFKRKKIAYHFASKLTLPPPPDGADTPNSTGLPRRIVANVIVPADAPPLLGGGGTDGACYQVIVVFGASAAALAQWQAEGSPAAKLFENFHSNAPEGLLPTSGDLDIKERLKLLPQLDNIDDLGLPGWITGYNGKPALIQKSGVINRGDDYLEIGINLFRFGFLTKKGMHFLLPRFSEFDFHAALTLEGREDSELPERTLLAGRVRGLDIAKHASDYDIDAV